MNYTEPFLRKVETAQEEQTNTNQGEVIEQRSLLIIVINSKTTVLYVMYVNIIQWC